MLVQRTEFGIAVKKRLIEIGQTQKWLVDRVNEVTGLKMDSSRMRKILVGRAKSARVEAVIRELLDM